MSRRPTALLPPVWACWTCLALLLPASLHAAATLELFGTFHAMGVVVDIGAADDPDMDAQATVRWRAGDAGPLHQGYPLARVSATRFVGSLFRLRPGVAHEVHVELRDPDSPVTRDQMAVFLVTTFELAGGAPTPPADPQATSPDGGR